MVSRGKVNILDRLIACTAIACLVLSFSFKPVYGADAPTEGSSGGESSSSSGSSSASGSGGAGGAGGRGGAGGVGMFLGVLSSLGMTGISHFICLY